MARKRPGRKARLERQKRARKEVIDIRYPSRRDRHDGISPGRLVVYAEIRKVVGQ